MAVLGLGVPFFFQGFLSLFFPSIFSFVRVAILQFDALLRHHRFCLSVPTSFTACTPSGTVARKEKAKTKNKNRNTKQKQNGEGKEKKEKKTRGTSRS